MKNNFIKSIKLEPAVPRILARESLDGNSVDVFVSEEKIFDRNWMYSFAYNPMNKKAPIAVAMGEIDKFEEVLTLRLSVEEAKSMIEGLTKTLEQYLLEKQLNGLR